jgi:hypothetical protein
MDMYSLTGAFFLHAEQGGISFSTNQRFCLHFCPKPIRMRKTLHHMKFDNKRMGVTSELFCKRFFGFLP